MPRTTPVNGFPAIVTEIKPDGLSLTVDELPPQEGRPNLTDSEIVAILEGYRVEAEYGRLSGPNSRDFVWLDHWDLYHNRFDFSKKAEWQAHEVLPEFPQYVDRLAAALRMALTVGRFFTVTAPNDPEGDLAKVIRKILETVLARVGRTTTGQRIDFSAFFEDAMKMAAISLPACVVTWKDNGEGGYAAIDLEDAYNVWFDPTNRGLYRIRRVEMDLNELRDLMDITDSEGEALYSRDAVMAAWQAGSAEALMRAERQKRTGTGQWTMSTRRPIVLHEYYCTLIDPQGYCHGKNVLCVVANGQHLLRGPEKNPFWHGQDWLVAKPLITVPLSPYGRTYAENFSRLAKTFNELTNLILDGVATSVLKVFVGIPENLEDPSQLEEGLGPNTFLRALPGNKPDEVLGTVDFGQLPPEAMQLWQAIKAELQAGAAFNEMTLGNSAPKGRTSATEINTVDSNSSSYMRSIAANIETWLEAVLDLLWKTTIQHLSRKDKEISDAIGQDWFNAILARRKEFATYKFSFVCRGITSLLQRKQKLQDLLQLLQIVGASPILAQQMGEIWSPAKLFGLLATLSDVDSLELEMSPQEQMMSQQKTQQAQQQQQQAEQQQAQQQSDLKTQQNIHQTVAKAAVQHLMGMVGKAGGEPGQPGGGAPSQTQPRGQQGAKPQATA